MIKIGIIIPYGIYGGAEVYIENILKNKPSNLQVTLLYLNQNLISEKIKMIGGIINKRFQNSDEFVKDLMVYNYTHIVYYNRLDIYNLLVSLKKSLKIRSNLIEIYHSDFVWSGSLSSIRQREYLDKFITISQSLGADIAGVDGKRVVVPVGIDLNRFKDSPGNITKDNLGISGKVIGTVARLSKEKNIDLLINLSEKLPDFNFLVAGDGPEKEYLKSLISKKKVKNFILVGHINNPESYYPIFDAFILLSKMEGTPISILESMACGVPVFSNGVGAIKDIVTDKRTGYILQGKLETFPSQIREGISDSKNIVSLAKEFIRENHDIVKNSQKFYSIFY